MYINDITYASEDGHFVLFADDTNKFVVGKTKEEVYLKSNQVLTYLLGLQWFVYSDGNSLSVGVAMVCL